MSTELIHALGAKENMTLQEKAELRLKIERLENAMNEVGEKMEIETKHHFSKDVYAREMFLNKDTLIVGKIHKHKNLNILSSGEALVASVDGIKEVKAPYTFVSDPGAKRVIFAKIDKIEELFIAKNYSEVAGITGDELSLLANMGAENAYLESDRTLDDVLKALGFSKEDLTIVSENESDLVPFPHGEYHIDISDSPIHGKGVFSTKEFKAGEVVAPARIDGKRTPAGRYANHASLPNAEMIMNEVGDVHLVATTLIPAGEEILTDYYFNFVNTRSELCHG
jgi:hypothetical protein